MAGKGTVEANAAVTNQFRLEIPGTPDILFVRVGELERLLVLAEMPDKTMQSTGQVQPGEFEADIMAHHTAARVALDAMFELARTGAPLNKVVGTMHYLGADGASVKLSKLLDGLICKGSKLPEMQSGDDGEGVKVTYMFSYDDVIPI